VKVKPVKIIVFILVACCLLGALAASLVNVPLSLRGSVPAGSQYNPYSGSGVPGAPPPARGNCGNINKIYPNNPFFGWPVEFHQGDWRTMSAWFCDPRYLIDMGADHWGVDLASLVEVTYSPEGLFEVGYTTMYGSYVVATVQEGEYGVVYSANEGGYNFGMGSHVKIMALTCAETCGSKPPKSELEPGEHVWELAENSHHCEVGGNSTPQPGATPKPPEYEDLLLWCEETGWVATYMHLEKVLVTVEQLIERGDKLGTVDSTGNSTGHHLHYQINGPGAGAIDPAPSMCSDYNPELRVTVRHQRGKCGGY
jgi:murein DD-endopeptidase MepM/ murein hydrolase activator NlpD